MEQVRFLLAIALSFLVLFVWQNYFLEQPAIPPVDEAETQVTSELLNNTLPTEVKQQQIPVDNKIEDQSITLTQDIPIRKILVQTPLLEIEFSEKGAAIQNIKLVNYNETSNEDSPLKSIIQFDGLGTALISFQNNVIPHLDKVFFKAETQQSFIQVNTLQKINFTYVSKQGIQVVKTYIIDPDSYLIGLSVSIDNSTTFPISDQLKIISRRHVPEEVDGYFFEGPALLLNHNLEEVALDSLEKKNTFSGLVSWAAIEDRYFASAVIPLEYQEDLQIKINLQNNIINLALKLPPLNIAPQTKKVFNFDLFFGPKSLELLNGLDNDLNEIINFGWFDILARPCLYLMNLIYKVIPNYGIAIILLTIFIKIPLWPLGNKSYKSMNEMRKLQPMMKKLQEKYKDDRNRMNQELMALYKTYKVNPLGGCLPMVLQIPVFIALYRMLYQAIELRHAPFFLWINDLSAPDRLFNFNIYIPLMEEPYGIPVLTIIMGATMLIQQKMSPPPGDPSQAKMMMFLPIVFTVIFINFPAGLVLYWLVNNVASILQQYYINKKNA
ncbi:Membrane insertion protein, OxaA/YidC [Candidatus Magnetomorum sp. HK-1]|nr:Membrane insertion protein, OxaA/YidC [Candidatus Magnetomorum sp. HK-1]